MLHQGVGGFDGGSIYALDQAWWGAGLERGLLEHSHSFARADLRARMGADDDGVAGFERDQSFVDGRGGGIGGGQNGGHDAHGNGNLYESLIGDLAKDTDGFQTSHGARQNVRGQEVLG